MSKNKYLFLFVVLLLLATATPGCVGTDGLYAQQDSNSGDDPPPIGPPPGLSQYPPKIGELVATAKSDKVTLSWQDISPYENGFEVWRDKIKVGETEKNVAVWSDTQVVSGATYCYAVIAFNKEYWASSEEKCITVPMPSPPPDTIAPSMPTNFDAPAASSTQINLSWTTSTDTGGSGLAGYYIYRDNVKIATLGADAISYYDTGLTPSTSYSYTIIAYDNAGNKSAWFAMSNHTKPPPDTVTPTTPANLAVTATSAQVNLSWTASTDTGGSGLAGYYVYRDGVKITDSPYPNTVYYSGGLSAETNYCYTVSAVDGDGNESEKSNRICAVTLPPPPPPDTVTPTTPANLAVTATSAQVNLSWTASTDTGGSGLAGYYIYRDDVKIATPSAGAVSYSDSSSNLIIGKNYCYAISAFDTANNTSAKSSAVCATLPPPNQSPTVAVWYPRPVVNELVYKITRVYVILSDPDDQFITLRLFISSVEKVSVEVPVKPKLTGQWFDVDFTGYADGDYTITAEVYDPHNASASSEVAVHTNVAELEKKAIDVLWKGAALTTGEVVRWENLPLRIEVSPLLTQEQFKKVQNAAAFHTKYTGVTFEVAWSDIETLNIHTCETPPQWILDKRIIYIYSKQPDFGPQVVATACNTINNGIIKDSIIEIAPNTLLDTEKIELIIAHELAHSFLTHEHEDNATYLMYWIAMHYRLSPEMIRATEKLYFEMKPGDPLPQLVL